MLKDIKERFAQNLLLTNMNIITINVTVKRYQMSYRLFEQAKPLLTKIQQHGYEAYL